MPQITAIVDVSDILQDGNVLNAHDLPVVARLLRYEANDSQEETAARLDVSQSMVSRAEGGESRYRSLCIRMIELYSDFEVEHPLYRLRKAPE